MHVRSVIFSAHLVAETSVSCKQKAPLDQAFDFHTVLNEEQFREGGSLPGPDYVSQPFRARIVEEIEEVGDAGFRPNGNRLLKGLSLIT